MSPRAARPAFRPGGVRWLAGAPVTRTLLVLNVAVFGVQLLVTRGKSLMHLPEHEALAFGASYSLAVVGENRWETLVTACFLHDGVVHIAFNMLLFCLAGPLVERSVGSARMAPMYLVAGATGNVASLAVVWSKLASHIIVGASGAICGLFAAALVVGWRMQGFRGPITQTMLWWLGLVLVVGLVSLARGGSIDNAAHLGGAGAGAAIAAGWRPDYRYSERMTAAILAGCSAAVIACIAIVVVRDHSGPFAAMSLQERDDFTSEALGEGRCRDARDGLFAVERLRAKMAPVTSLRRRVLAACGHVLGAPP